MLRLVRIGNANDAAPLIEALRDEGAWMELLSTRGPALPGWRWGQGSAAAELGKRKADVLGTGGL
jgi:hypothetical protein